ncbi:nitrite/sulfite reductase [Magnetococcus sp. PR-3]|uniref:nitrite/sulfite reductase n=1 Tax=Magnetococcus sp. PR-3 TaxID=3120355 RepID=UPI002FCE23E2
MERQLNTQSLVDAQDADLYENGLQAYLSGRWHPERWKGFRLRFGIYGQRQADQYMVRVKLPGGSLAPEGLVALGQLSEQYGDGTLHLTTRQGVQLYGVALADTPDLLRGLNEAGLTTREASGNTFRAVTSCPFAGICPQERVDASEVAEQLTTAWIRHPLTQHMPRKFKTSVSGCDVDCGLTAIDDLGLVATEQDGRVGFQVRVAGGLGHQPQLAETLLPFVEASALTAVQEALARLHHHYSNRQRKTRSRIKFLVRDWGIELFRKRFTEIFEEIQKLPRRLWEPLQWHQPETTGEKPQEIDQHGWLKGRDGQVGVVIKPKLGWLTAVQAASLGQVAAQWPISKLRLTREQTVVAIGELQGQEAAFAIEVNALGMAAGDTSRKQADLISCPGTTTCALAITNAKGLGEALHAGGKRSFPIRVSGCPNACGHHSVATVGLAGFTRKVAGQPAPFYRLTVGGVTGNHADQLGQPVAELPAADVPSLLDRLDRVYNAEKVEQESFAVWFQRQGKTLLPEGVDETRLETRIYRDLGDTGTFVPPPAQPSGGECAAGAATGEHWHDLALVYQGDIRRYLSVGDDEQAENAALSAILAAGQRLLVAKGVENHSTETKQQLHALKAVLKQEQALLEQFEAVWQQHQQPLSDKDWNQLLQVLEQWIDGADQRVEQILASVMKWKVAS